MTIAPPAEADDQSDDASNDLSESLRDTSFPSLCKVNRRDQQDEEACKEQKREEEANLSVHTIHSALSLSQVMAGDIV